MLIILRDHVVHVGGLEAYLFLMIMPFVVVIVMAVVAMLIIRLNHVDLVEGQVIQHQEYRSNIIPGNRQLYFDLLQPN
jgi:hypothetical protein